MINLGTASKARWATGLFFVLSGLITASWSSRIPDVQRHFQLSNAAWGTVLFAMPLGQLTGLLAAGWLMARFGVLRAMSASTVLCAAVLLLAGASNSRWQLTAALFLLGFGRTLLNLSVNTRATEVQKLFPQPIMSSFHGMWSLACFAAAGLGTLMLVKGWLPLHHFLLVATPSIALALYFDWRSNRGVRIVPEKKPLLVKPDRYLTLLGSITFFGMLCENVLFDWSVNYFEQTVRAPRSMITYGYTAYMLSMTAGRLLGDRMAGRFGPLRMLQANGLLMTLGFVLSAAMPTLVPALAGFCLIGLGNSIVVPVVYALAARSKKMTPPYALAAVTLLGYCGFLTGPLLTGAVAGAVGMQWAFGLLATCGVGIVVFAVLLHRFLGTEEATGAATA